MTKYLLILAFTVATVKAQPFTLNDTAFIRVGNQANTAPTPLIPAMYNNNYTPYGIAECTSAYSNIAYAGFNPTNNIDLIYTNNLPGGVFTISYTFSNSPSVVTASSWNITLRPLVTSSLSYYVDCYDTNHFINVTPQTYTNLINNNSTNITVTITLPFTVHFTNCTKISWYFMVGNPPYTPIFQGVYSFGNFQAYGY